MCKICYSDPCNRDCPNAPVGRKVGVCKACGYTLFHNDEVTAVKINGIYNKYHYDCFIELSAPDFVNDFELSDVICAINERA